MPGEDIMEKNGELSVPPVPGRRFREGRTQIPWDSEILQSFTELTNITIFFRSFDPYKHSLEDFTYQLLVGGNLKCGNQGHHEQCVPRHSYHPWYIWTKEGFKIQINKFEIIMIFIASIY